VPQAGSDKLKESRIKSGRGENREKKIKGTNVRKDYPKKNGLPFASESRKYQSTRERRDSWSRELSIAKDDYGWPQGKASVPPSGSADLTKTRKEKQITKKLKKKSKTILSVREEGTDTVGPDYEKSATL